MSSIPVLPDIKKHRLNLQKASNRVLENYNACRSTGITSDAYKTIDNNFTDQVGTNILYKKLFYSIFLSSKETNANSKKIKILKTNNASFDFNLQRNENNNLSIDKPKVLVLKR